MREAWVWSPAPKKPTVFPLSYSTLWTTLQQLQGGICKYNTMHSIESSLSGKKKKETKKNSGN